MGIANNEERYVGLLRLHLLDTHCIRKYHLTSFQNFRSLAPIVAFIHENETLRREAIHIEILYRIKPLRRKMVGLTYQWVGDQIFDTLAQPFTVAFSPMCLAASLGMSVLAKARILASTRAESEEIFFIVCSGKGSKCRPDIYFTTAKIENTGVVS
jgi:hypothetical protein